MKSFFINATTGWVPASAIVRIVRDLNQPDYWRLQLVDGYVCQVYGGEYGHQSVVDDLLEYFCISAD